jgi:predicted amidohydrolase
MRSRVVLLLVAVPLSLAIEAHAADSDDSGESASVPRYVRIGHYQCICRQGDFQANLRKVIEGLEMASEAGLEIVSFPESFLTGYFRNEEEARASSFSIDSPQMNEVLKRTAHFEPMFMVGFNELRGEELHNTVAVILLHGDGSCRP